MDEPDWWKVKDGVAAEEEIRAGDLAYEDEANAVFSAARWALEAHKQGVPVRINKHGVAIEVKKRPKHATHLLIPLDEEERGDQ